MPQCLSQQIDLPSLNFHRKIEIYFLAKGVQKKNDKVLKRIIQLADTYHQTICIQHARQGETLINSFHSDYVRLHRKVIEARKSYHQISFSNAPQISAIELQISKQINQFLAEQIGLWRQVKNQKKIPRQITEIESICKRFTLNRERILRSSIPDPGRSNIPDFENSFLTGMDLPPPTANTINPKTIAVPEIPFNKNDLINLPLSDTPHINKNISDSTLSSISQKDSTIARFSEMDSTNTENAANEVKDKRHIDRINFSFQVEPNQNSRELFVLGTIMYQATEKIFLGLNASTQLPLQMIRRDYDLIITRSANQTFSIPSIKGSYQLHPKILITSEVANWSVKNFKSSIYFIGITLFQGGKTRRISTEILYDINGSNQLLFRTGINFKSKY